jgi:hypothetical protein
VCEDAARFKRASVRRSVEATRTAHLSTVWAVSTIDTSLPAAASELLASCTHARLHATRNARPISYTLSSQACLNAAFDPSALAALQGQTRKIALVLPGVLGGLVRDGCDRQY